MYAEELVEAAEALRWRSRCSVRDRVNFDWSVPMAYCTRKLESEKKSAGKTGALSAPVIWKFHTPPSASSKKLHPGP